MEFLLVLSFRRILGVSFTRKIILHALGGMQNDNHRILTPPPTPCSLSFVFGRLFPHLPPSERKYILNAPVYKKDITLYVHIYPQIARPISYLLLCNKDNRCFSLLSDSSRNHTNLVFQFVLFALFVCHFLALLNLRLRGLRASKIFSCRFKVIWF